MSFEQRTPQDQRRWLLFIALAAPIWILGMMWVQRNQQMAARQRQAAEQVQAVESATPAATPGLPGSRLEAPGPGMPPVSEGAVPGPAEFGARPADAESVMVVTDSARIEFTAAGAVPMHWTLVDPKATNGHGSTGGEAEAAEAGDAPPARAGIDLIDPALHEYGLALPFEIVLKEQNAKFYHELNRLPYTVSRAQQDGTTVLRFESPVTESGLQVVKTYRIPKQGFEAELRIELVNTGTARLTFNNQGQGLGLALGPGMGKAPEPEAGFGGGRYEFTHPFYREDSGIVTMKTAIGEEPAIFVDPAGEVKLAGLHDRYFLFAALPADDFPGGKAFTSGKSQIDVSLMEVALANKDTINFYPRLEIYTDPLSLEPGQSVAYGWRIYAGPKERSILKATGLGLERILFYDSWGWMRALCFLMMSLLGFFHTLLRSWGLAIIAVVVTVRLLTFPLTQIGMRHQAAMMAQQARLKPHLDKINEKYKDNPAKRNQEMMKLYREHNVNPFGMLKGCLWMFIQLPIFFALYKLLSQDFDLRGASFLWIEDLSKADRLLHLGFSIPFMGEYFNLLPVLTAATQMLVSKLTMNPQAVSDPQQAAIQKQMMYMMPVMILVMTYQFPSGLCLYWMISNVWQVVQQRFVNKKILHAPASVATT